MALSLSKRKRPEREDKMLVERQRKFSERVFDDTSIKTLKFLMNNKVFSHLDYPIQHGKEAAVFCATKEINGKKEYLAVKVFKYEGPSFQKRMQYLEGDRRYKAPHGRRDMVKIFAKKEFANLKICYEAKVHVPKPIKHRDNIVVMEFLGEGGIPSALLKDVYLADPKKTLNEIIRDMRKMHEAKLVHADLSEFNIIIQKGEPYIIDVGQAVMIHHPQANEFLLNDLGNILKYFRKEGADANFDVVLKYIKGESNTFE